ncbi:hypothetical protein MPTK1_4g09050 [Marchantia polymorpha subsp. ruderalis]|uniref:Uncharacterized protein n=2 Tax=Marchantia polymorpha TaxID=3197 RepID=A0AAF6B7Y6_MARPO|nr:hypothetical protein MARPO_0112s0006 [Marchantia polymorpha]BBN08120.1 hypothetical protein Mp_4g09050 [Marchantia polymorpha subsp. ruderalis]|eukprot:PTQ31345.1 hypothetical protein MARPO_0112s0006 [Marchantia polymorpha]
MKLRNLSGPHGCSLRVPPFGSSSVSDGLKLRSGNIRRVQGIAFYRKSHSKQTVSNPGVDIRPAQNERADGRGRTLATPITIY